MVRGIGSNQHTTAEYVDLDMYIPGRHDDDGRPVEALLRCQAFVVNDLRAKMLVGMDILATEDIDLIISTRSGYIGSCRTTFDLTIAAPPRSFIKQNVMLEKSISIPARSHMAVPIERVILPPGDYMFEPTHGCSVALFAAVVDSSFHAVLARNDSEQAVLLPKRLQVGSIMDLEFDSCYHLEDAEEAQEMAIRLPKQTHQAAWSTKAFAKLASKDSGASEDQQLRKPSATRASAVETILANRVTVYGVPEVVTKLATIVDEFAKI